MFLFSNDMSRKKPIKDIIDVLLFVNSEATFVLQTQNFYLFQVIFNTSTQKKLKQFREMVL